MRFHHALRAARATALLLLLVLLATPALAQKAARPAGKATSSKSAPKPTPKSKSNSTPTSKPPSKPTPTPKAASIATPASPPASRQAASRDSATTAAPPVVTTATAMGAARAARSVTVHEGPGGRTLATLAPGTVVLPVAREGGWVKVRLEAWVPERELLPADTTLTVGLAAADLRADPEGMRGRMVRWEVELLAFQVADALRRELAPDEPYLLVRGPGDENAMLYLALPPSLVATARGLPPLTRLLVTARVRNGRSSPAGLPILDLLALTPLRRG